MSKRESKDADHQMSVEIGHRIKTLRRSAGLSQEKVAEELGITFQQVQKYEKGTNRISAPKLVQLCKVLGVEPDALLGVYFADSKPAHPNVLDRLSSVESKLAQIRALAA